MAKKKNETEKLSDLIRQTSESQGISEEQVLQSIKEALLSAYRRKFGTDENAFVTFAEDMSDVLLYSRKKIVSDVMDPVLEISIEEANSLAEGCEEGDEIDILIDPKNDFNRSAVQAGRRNSQQTLHDIQKDSLYLEYKEKIGEIIIGYYQREYKGAIYMDLGRVEGYFPAKFQSPREVYKRGDRIKALIEDVRKTPTGLQVVLTRSSADFVQRILELEVPEIYDQTIRIHKIVREAGYRTKVAVYSTKEDIDPVGACVGMRGVRIQNVIRELEGEKIDVLRYDPDPRIFIRNVLSPAEVGHVIILDEEKRQALAVVSDDQLALAIGKQGQNVRLANRLADWIIDVKSESQAEEIEEITAAARRDAVSIFNDDYDEITMLDELTNADEKVIEALKAAGINEIEEYFAYRASENPAPIEGVTEEMLVALDALIDSLSEEEPEESSLSHPESESATEEEAVIGEDEEVYECPECGAPITINMTKCPKCGIGLSFEFEDEE